MYMEPDLNNYKYIGFRYEIWSSDSPNPYVKLSNNRIAVYCIGRNIYKKPSIYKLFLSNLNGSHKSPTRTNSSCSGAHPLYRVSSRLIHPPMYIRLARYSRCVGSDQKFANEICVPFAPERGQDNAQPGEQREW